MQELNENLQFETKLQNSLNHLFKNKLTGKGYAIRLIALLGIGLALSSFTTEFLVRADHTTINLFTSIFKLILFINFIISTSLSVRRVRDIVPDDNIWPYAVSVILISLIPIVSYLLYLLLIILPSNYLTRDKRNQLMSKFS